MKEVFSSFRLKGCPKLQKAQKRESSKRRKTLLQTKQLQTFNLHESKKELLEVMQIADTFIQDKERALFYIGKREAGTVILKLKMQNYFLDI